MNTVGIRREDKTDQERRAPLAPRHVRELTGSQQLRFLVESSSSRVFNDREYEEAGAQIVQDLPSCDLVIGVKEIPLERLQPGRPYLFFSHTIKAQSYNMPLLKRILEQSCTLIDYELVTDDQGRRLIFFGAQAGQAGMINSLWSLGQRWRVFGYDTPFAELKQAKEYASLDEARDSIRTAGKMIREEGIHPMLTPIVCGIAGYGSVSKGAQEMLDLLEPESVSPDELLKMNEAHHSRHQVFKVVFKEEDLVRRNEDSSPFDLQEYYDSPELYRSKFSGYIPLLTLLVNAIYWEPRYPRLVTREHVKAINSGIINPKLAVISDITCDVGGSIECNMKTTMPDNPVYIVNERESNVTDGFKGEGLLIMAEDILPTEIPRESTEAFGDMLAPYLADIASAVSDAPLESLPLPAPFRKAVIAHQGKLAPGFEYLKESLPE